MSISKRVRGFIGRRPLTAVLSALAVAILAVAVDPIAVPAALLAVALVSLAVAVAGIRLVDRAPRGRTRWVYILAVCTGLYALLEMVLMGSSPGKVSTWTWVVTFVWPFVFVAYVLQRDDPEVSAASVLAAVPRTRWWLLIAGALAALLATWPIESDVVRWPLLAVIVVATGVAVDRAGRAALAS